MMFIYKITGVKVCVLLRKHHDITFSENDAAAYTLYFRPHKKFILTANLLTFLEINLKTMYIQKIEK